MPCLLDAFVLFILAITVIVATIEHLTQGDIAASSSFVPYLLVGMLGGAQLGAFLSKRVPSAIIMKSLAVAIFLVGIRIVWAHHPEQPRVAPVRFHRTGMG